MTDPGLNQALKWAIENSAASQPSNANQPSDPRTTTDRTSGLNPDILAQLLGGPSDADRMREAMTSIVSPHDDLANKLIAWDNLEQLIENLDNANNMGGLGLWTPLAEKLGDDEAEVRRMAAWCCGTAVQNNVKSQESLLLAGAIPKLVHLAVHEPDAAARKKAIMALSSEVRNYAPGLDEALRHLPREFLGDAQKPDAGDMDAIDRIMQRLREASGGV
ncbi:hsp70 nucleotide exchange factor fes1 [Elasticomyces elasticus]|nr:hsp70 nucleotide exchange factor fes1 [Elasticomyces elasticus]